MKKHLLLTVGDYLNSLYGVRFVASFFRNKADTSLALLYVAPRYDAMDTREAGLQHQMDCRMADMYREKGQNALDVSLRFLCDHGFASGNLSTKLICRRHGTVKDIVQEGHAGLFKPVLTTPDSIRELCLEANSSPACVGLITWMHTFSPAKMWIAGLNLLKKPFVHLHTQFNQEIPWAEIDMDFKNLNQSAHGGPGIWFYRQPDAPEPQGSGRILAG